MSSPFSIASAPYAHSSLRVFENPIYKAFALAAEWEDLDDVRAFIKAHELAVVYVLVGAPEGRTHSRIGEGGKLHQRLLKHLSDPRLGFVKQIFVLASPSFDKAAVVYLQERLTRLAQGADRSVVIMGTNPISGFPLQKFSKEVLDITLSAGLATLADAGCHVLRPRAPARSSSARAVPR